MAVPIWANRLIMEKELFNSLLEEVSVSVAKDMILLRNAAKRADVNNALLIEGRIEGKELLAKQLIKYEMEARENGDI